MEYFLCFNLRHNCNSKQIESQRYLSFIRTMQNAVQLCSVAEVPIVRKISVYFSMA